MGGRDSAGLHSLHILRKVLQDQAGLEIRALWKSRSRSDGLAPQVRRLQDLLLWRGLQRLPGGRPPFA